VLRYLGIFFEAVWPYLSKIVTTAWQIILLVISTVVDTILGLVRLFLLLLTGDWEGAWVQVKTILQKHLQGARDVITRVLTLILGFFGVSLDSLASTITDWTATQLTALIAWLTGIYTRVTTWFTDLVGAVGRGWQTIASSTSSWWGSIATNISSWWGSIANSISSWMGSVASGMSGWWGSISANVSSWWGNINDSIKGWIGSIKTSITGMFSGVHISLPHFDVDWQELPVVGRVPRGINVNWYGMGLDAIFDKPTLIGVGEAGAERVQVTPTSGQGSATGATYNITVNAVQDDAVYQLDALLRRIQMGTVA